MASWGNRPAGCGPRTDAMCLLTRENQIAGGDLRNCTLFFCRKWPRIENATQYLHLEYTSVCHPC